MAVTKIWSIKLNINDALKYIANPEKTVNPDLKNALHYAGNEAKTYVGEEKTLYVTGVNCKAESAYDEMFQVQKRFNKVGGNVAYHAYQSFKRGEVTPEVAHKVGVELAEKMWGADYQILVATHFNTGTYHNHFVVNSVNMWTGKKFNCNKGAYYHLRALSDEICKEHGLYVIENPSGKTPRNIYFAEKNKEPTKFNLMREAIDFAITCSGNHNDFRKIMRELGYVVELNPNRTYWTIRSLNSKKNVRMFRLGADYTNQRIMERIRAEGNSRFQKGYEFWNERKAFRKYQPKKIYLNGSLKDSRKITGLKAFYYLFATLLGLYPKQNPHKPLSPEMKEAWLKIDRFSEEIHLVHKENLNDLGDVNAFIASVQAEIESTENARQKIYNRLRRCSDPDERSELFSKRDECTERLRQLRKQKKTAIHITEDNSEIKEKIQIERQAQDRFYGREPKENYRKRGYLR